MPEVSSSLNCSFLAVNIAKDSYNTIPVEEL
jgi:hypothetical protein